MFEHVYLVSTRLKLVEPAAFDELSSARPCPFPHGYREYLTELGSGELSHFLRVRVPREVIASQDEDCEFLGGDADSLEADVLYRTSVLPAAEIRTAVVFATTIDGDMLIGCREHPGKLFCVPRHDNKITEVPRGFLGAVEDCRQRTEDQFAYFEPYTRSRRACGFTMRSPSSVQQFIELVAARWGQENVCASNPVTAQYALQVFVRPIQAHITLFLENPGQNIPGQNPVVLMYDNEFDREVTEFVETHRIADTEVWKNPKVM